jgi:hypothetical protein
LTGPEGANRAPKHGTQRLAVCKAAATSSHYCSSPPLRARSPRPPAQARAGVLQAAVTASEGKLAHASAASSLAGATPDCSGGGASAAATPSASNGAGGGGGGAGSASDGGSPRPGSGGGARDPAWPGGPGPDSGASSSGGGASTSAGGGRGGGGCGRAPSAISPEFLWLYREYISTVRRRMQADGTVRPLEPGEQYYPPNKVRPRGGDAAVKGPCAL